MVHLSTGRTTAGAQDWKVPALPVPDDPHLRPSALARYRNLLVMFAVGVPVFFVTIQAGWTRNVPPLTWVALLLIFFCAALFLFQRRQRRFNAATVAANAALARGEAEKAGAAFEEIARRYRGDAALHAAAVYNVGVVRYKQGDQRAALACFGVAAKTRGLADQAPAVAECAPYVIANCYTLIGDLDAAAHWLREGRQRAKLREWPIDAPSEALLRCRQGDYPAAYQILAARWREIEGMLPAEFVREIVLIRAFAQSRAQGLGDVRTLVPGIEQYDLQQYAYYGREWPEFREFLSELHAGLDREQARTGSRGLDTPPADSGLHVR